MFFEELYPLSLVQNYRDIRTLPCIKSRTFTDDDISQLESLLNGVEMNDKYAIIKNNTRFLYRKNPRQFYSFIKQNRLRFLVLWTESRLIMRDLNIRGLVHIRWDDELNQYLCAHYDPQYKELYESQVNAEHMPEDFHELNAETELQSPIRILQRTDSVQEQDLTYVPKNIELSVL